MATVRIYDYTENGGLALDLRDLLALLGSRSLQAIWTVSPVKLYYPSLNSFQEEFMATGQGSDQLGEHARNRSPVSGIALAELAKATRQVIWGEFAADLPGGQAFPRKIFRLTCRANQWFLFARPVSIRGALAIVTNVGRDAVDAKRRKTNGAKADGEVVWS